MQRLQSTLAQSHSLQDLRNLEQNEPSKPIVPELCLDTIWVDSPNSREFTEEASHGFLHHDLIGQTYLCYLMPHTFKLNFAKLEESYGPVKPAFEMITSVPAKDAVDLRVSSLY